MAKLLYQGHGSYRIVTDEGFVLYVAPYVGASSLTGSGHSN